MIWLIGALFLMLVAIGLFMNIVIKNYENEQRGEGDSVHKTHPGGTIW